MRLAVLDVGSNTVHLLVVDAHQGARPLPATSHKELLRLAEYLGPDGSISEVGERMLIDFVHEALTIAEDQGAEAVVSFATSAIREAPNGAQVLARVKKQTGVDLTVLSGSDEARLTFLATRRWFGWSAGHIMLFDIGGGSLEIAAGGDETADCAVSVPLGAGRLTNDWFSSDLPTPEEIATVRRHARTTIGKVARDVIRAGRPDRVVGSSKTFRSLARLTGAAPSADGIHVPRYLRHKDLAELTPRLAALTPQERAQLPGVSEARAQQVLAGAIVAEAACAVFDVDEIQICPWALREGVILRKLDKMTEEQSPSPRTVAVA
ncbi:Ppx/GppA phosphatase family protein [Saxibacter everestensis]|uniref:Ppx/GppA phosphatase family protein n=1 Tax=Saxibacter everestensis TaxID=2909229 RepID=A0ABY8QRG9_9MICO|nr:Ppx/GppA phosphatase family protein [Brevibacteriaceae bacterium ZFBP1038]